MLCKRFGQLTITKSFILPEVKLESGKQAIAYWSQKGFVFPRLSDKAIVGRRGSSWRNFVFCSLNSLKTKLIVLIDESNHCTCTLDIKTGIQPITPENEKHWLLELDTFESFMLHGDLKEQDYKLQRTLDRQQTARRIVARITATATVFAILWVYLIRFSPISHDVMRRSSSHGHYWTVSTQLALGLTPDWSDLKESIWGRQPAIAELLVRHGVNIEHQWLSGEPNGPPLAWALMYGEKDIARMLLKHGAHADYKPRFHGKNTALHMAVELNDPELVNMLLKNGANPNAADDCGTTQLMLAIHYNRPKIAEILRKVGAKESSKTIVRGGRYCYYADK